MPSGFLKSDASGTFGLTDLWPNFQLTANFFIFKGFIYERESQGRSRWRRISRLCAEHGAEVGLHPRTLRS